LFSSCWPGAGNLVLLGYSFGKGLLSLYYFYLGNKREASLKCNPAESKGDDPANLGVINQPMEWNTVQH